MLYEIVPNKTIVYEYIPQWLNSHHKPYMEHMFFNTQYSIDRLNSGLLYSNLEDLKIRIKTEREIYERRKKLYMDKS